MTTKVTKKTGFVMRIMSLGAFSFMMIFASIVIVENKEITKLLPDSPARSMAIFFGYIVSVYAFNYALAIKGRNFMGWLVESLLMLGVLFLFAGLYLPYAFPSSEIIENNSFIPFLSSEVTKSPNYWFSGFVLGSIPCFLIAFQKVKTNKVWKDGDML